METGGPRVGVLTRPLGGYGEPVGAADHERRTADHEERAAADRAAEAAWSRGDEIALRRAWDQFGTLIHTYCVRALGDRELAADCTQETFLGAWRARARYDLERGALAAWLLGIARHKVLDARRRSARVPVAQADDGGRLPDAESDHQEELSDRLLLAHALETLSTRAREVIELAFYSDLTQVEIAKRLGLPLGTVKSDMRRGLQRLRAYLEEMGTRA